MKKQSVKEQLEELGYGPYEDVFMPKEYDRAFVGLARMCWNDGTPVYDISRMEDEFPQTPEGMKSPILLRPCSGKDVKDDENCFTPVKDLLPAIIGRTEGDNHLVYEYTKLTESLGVSYIKDQYESGDNGYHILDEIEDGEEFSDWRERVWSDAVQQGVEWVEFNTLRDYSYKEQRPIVISDMRYQIVTLESEIAEEIVNMTIRKCGKCIDANNNKEWICHKYAFECELTEALLNLPGTEVSVFEQCFINEITDKGNNRLASLYDKCNSFYTIQKVIDELYAFCEYIS